ncbi:MAG: RDD family protein, partial [Candidatus Binatia bacterium]
TEAFFGMTLGKIVAEAQVRSSEGRPIGMKASLIRNLLRVVDALPFFPLYLVGGFTVILTNRGLRLGDVAAGPIVVRREQGRGARAGALVVALVLGFAGVWGGFASQEAPSAASPVSATLAPSVSPDHEPINPTTTFSRETPVIHVAFRVSQAQPGSRLKAVWSAVDVGAAAPPNSQLAESTVILPGPAPGNFRFSRGPEPWPLGEYKVDLYLNDQLVLSLPYRIDG